MWFKSDIYFDASQSVHSNQVWNCHSQPDTQNRSWPDMDVRITFLNSKNSTISSVIKSHRRQVPVACFKTVQATLVDLHDRAGRGEAVGINTGCLWAEWNERQKEKSFAFEKFLHGLQKRTVERRDYPLTAYLLCGSARGKWQMLAISFYWESEYSLMKAHSSCHYNLCEMFLSAASFHHLA